MSNSIMVSVPIVTYNQEEYIAQTIDCIINQERDFSIELIIGEDCSQDRTREIVLSFKEKYPDLIRLILNEKNLGLIKNFANTIEACTGKYIAGCAGDDYWHNLKKLKRQVQFLEENEDYGMVFGDFNILKNGKISENHLSQSRKDIPSGYVFEEYLVSSFINNATACTRRDLFLKSFNQQLIKENGFLMEDRPFLSELTKNTKIQYLNESLMTRRIVVDSVSNSSDYTEQLKMLQSSYQVKQFFINKYGCFEETKVKVDINYNQSLLRFAFLTGNSEQAKSSLAYLKKNKEFKLSPRHFFYYYFSRKGLNLITAFSLFLRRKIKQLIIR